MIEVRANNGLGINFNGFIADTQNSCAHGVGEGLFEHMNCVGIEYTP